ncbi:MULTISPECIES: flagellar biosynthetic protein FliO [Bacillaceae]|uniref:Flagellar biosynthetic protein FliO n=1 Tax=Evansella alkalicola TaxID=745819 RepID=A0ABS6JQF1_9BACI|nr:MULTISPECIES: flagellar biosynthetic protein FliO [Bacillaceae]MBU9720331.1 flagellar biosynthetic protein FliO [Bacillus alkalicola]
MKHKVILFLVTTLVVFIIFPTIIHGEEQWEDGGGSVNDMFRDREEVETIDPQNSNDNELDEIETEEDDAEALEEGDAEAVLGEGPDQNLFFLSLQMFFALAFVIFLIYALLKFVNNRSRSFRNHSTIESVGGVGLGSNRSVQMVRVGKKVYLLGVGESVNLLKEIEDPNEVEIILEEHRPQDTFDQPVMKVSNWVKENVMNRSAERDSSSFQSLFKKELNDVKESQDKVYSALKEKDQ